MDGVYLLLGPFWGESQSAILNNEFFSSSEIKILFYEIHKDQMS